MTQNPQLICDLFQVKYPIIQGGMIWVSGGKLAAACSNAGALGLVGAASMSPEILDSQLAKAKNLSSKPIGINLPLLYSRVEEQIELALKHNIKIFFTSAGSPKKYTAYLKDKGCTVVHVTSSPQLAQKCEAAGVDAIVAEGFEAGGHNGREEITTMALIPQVVDAVKIPVIAAGGIADGRGIAAAFALGASAVQIGSRFVATIESRAHENFKQAVVQAKAGDTMLTMKDIVPVRLLKNKFFQEMNALISSGAPQEEILALQGKHRAQRGMHDGDLQEGKLEIGQISALINDIPSAASVIESMVSEYQKVIQKLPEKL